MDSCHMGYGSNAQRVKAGAPWWIRGRTDRQASAYFASIVPRGAIFRRGPPVSPLRAPPALP